MYAITFAAAAVVWPFIVAFFANKFGPDVSARFLERPGRIPSNGKELSRESLEEWLRSPTTAKFRRPYAFVIMGLDLVYVVFVGGFMLTGSLWLAGALTWPEPVKLLPCVLLYVLPTLYMLSDAVEDALIATILQYQDVSNSAFAALRTATGIKIVAFGTAALQVLVLGLCAIFLSVEGGKLAAGL
jgi:hypothetical protein